LRQRAWFSGFDSVGIVWLVAQERQFSAFGDASQLQRMALSRLLHQRRPSPISASAFIFNVAGSNASCRPQFPQL